MAEQTELLDLASKFFNNIVKGFHNKVEDKDRGNKTISSSLVTEEVDKARKKFSNKKDVVYTGPDFTTITKFTKKLVDAYNRSVLKNIEKTKIRKNYKEVGSGKGGRGKLKKSNTVSPSVVNKSVTLKSNKNNNLTSTLPTLDNANKVKDSNKDSNASAFSRKSKTQKDKPIVNKTIVNKTIVNKTKVDKPKVDKPKVDKIKNVKSFEVRNINKKSNTKNAKSFEVRNISKKSNTKDAKPRTIAQAKKMGKDYFWVTNPEGSNKDDIKKAAVTAEELKKSGLSLRDYLNKKRGLKRKTKK